MRQELTLRELSGLQALGPDTYKQRIITLFRTQRATPEHYAAMAEAVLAVSESADGHCVTCLDRAVLPACPLCGDYCESFATAGED